MSTSGTSSPGPATIAVMQTVAELLAQLAAAPDVSLAPQRRFGQAAAMVQMELALNGHPDDRKATAGNVISLLPPAKRPDHVTRRPCPKCGHKAKGTTPRETQAGRVQYWRCECGWRETSPLGDPVNSGSITL